MTSLERCARRVSHRRRPPIRAHHERHAHLVVRRTDQVISPRLKARRDDEREPSAGIDQFLLQDVLMTREGQVLEILPHVPKDEPVVGVYHDCARGKGMPAHQDIVGPAHAFQRQFFQNLGRIEEPLRADRQRRRDQDEERRDPGGSEITRPTGRMMRRTIVGMPFVCHPRALPVGPEGGEIAPGVRRERNMGSVGNTGSSGKVRRCARSCASLALRATTPGTTVGFRHTVSMGWLFRARRRPRNGWQAELFEPFLAWVNEDRPARSPSRCRALPAPRPGRASSRHKGPIPRPNDSTIP